MSKGLADKRANVLFYVSLALFIFVVVTGRLSGLYTMILLGGGLGLGAIVNGAINALSGGRALEKIRNSQADASKVLENPRPPGMERVRLRYFVLYHNLCYLIGLRSRQQDQYRTERATLSSSSQYLRCGTVELQLVLAGNPRCSSR